MEFNDLEEKLVHDGGDRTRLRVNLLCMAIGVCLFFAAGLSLALKLLLERRTGQELFGFLPIGAAFSFCGAVTFAVTGVRSTYFLFRSQRREVRRGYLSQTLGCTGMVIGYAAAILFLIAVNAGSAILPAAISSATAAALCLFFAAVLRLPDDA